MEFNMYESGLHWYNPSYQSVVLINTIFVNTQCFPKTQIKGADQSKTLYYKLEYPSIKYFR